MSKAGVRAVEALALSMASELNSLADDLTAKVHSNVEGEELIEILANAVDALKNDTLQRVDDRLNELYTRYVRYAHI